MPQPVAGQKMEVLVFAADPRSAPSGGRQRLLIDEEVHEIRDRLKGAKYGDQVEVIDRGAVRTSDMLQLMREFQPQVVHFSGHGEVEGLVVVGKLGGEQFVNAKGLESLFRVRGTNVRLVVLNACFSLPLANALADQVGCAIGTPHKISDDAAVIFGSTFYHAIACGDSVRAAFDEAVAALDLDSIPEAQHPQLVHRSSVDPAKLYLISRDEPAPPPPSATRGWIFPLIVWVCSLAGSLWLVQNDLKAIGLSLVPLAITFTVLYLARTGGAPEPMRVRVVAVALAAISVVAGTKILNNELDTAKRLYAAGEYQAAFTLFKELAEEGDSEAKGYLGTMYMSPRGTAENDSAGIYWLSEAAKDGDPRGMYALGIAYETGEGVPADAKQALHWYRLAARKRHAEAMNKIGELYRRGPAGITQSDDSALVWYDRSADAGSMDGMSNLALMHELGLTGTPNRDEALRWHRRSAEKGYTRGMVDLAWVHQHGIVGQPNPDSAAYWLTRAAEAGDPYAMNNLGVLYATGSPAVPRDCAAARTWIQRAADVGFSQAVENLPRLSGCGS